MKPFAKEADLCASFMAAAVTSGWRCHAESNGFDIYCVAPKENVHLGIEAKLRFNLKVLMQATPSAWDYRGPDFHCVLVPPRVGYDEKRFAARGAGAHRMGRRPQVQGRRPGRWAARWPTERSHEPEDDSDQPAGVPAPISLTTWKRKALQVLAKIAVNGGVTRKEIGLLGIDNRRWCGPYGWLSPLGDGRFECAPKCPAFDVQHPTAYAKLLEKERANGAT